jgi:predicted metal-dependent HD superfamily phosphohydrolase
MHIDLADQWTQTWTDLALELPDLQVLHALLDHYREPHRAYHTLRHLEECFEEFDAVRTLCSYPGDVQLALWFHDAIYDTKGSDNEDRSASWAESVLAAANAPFAQRQRVRDFILVTKHDGFASTPDAGFVVDIDLSILGAGSERFDEYESQIRFEYSWVPESAFREARHAILNKFLERRAIYSTAHFRNRFEKQARANLERSLARLGESR